MWLRHILNRMPTQITKSQASELYLSQLQSEASRLSYVDQTIKRFMKYDPKTKRTIPLSYADLIREVQNRTQIGLASAVEYCQQLKNGKGEALYLVV